MVYLQIQRSWNCSDRPSEQYDSPLRSVVRKVVSGLIFLRTA